MNRVKRCCCGCSTKAGTSILMWCTTVSFGTLMTMTILQYGKGQKIFREDDWLFENFYYRAFVLNLFAIFMIIGILGLYGIYRNKAVMLIPYLIYRIVIDVCTIMFLFPLLINLNIEPRKFTDLPVFINHNEPPTREQSNTEFDQIFFSWLGIELLIIVTEIHFVKVIYSCYRTMRENDSIMTGEVIPLASECTWNNNNCYIKEPKIASYITPS